MYNLDFVKKEYRGELGREISSSLMVSDALHCAVYESAYIVPSNYPKGPKIGGVYDCNKKFVDNSALHIRYLREHVVFEDYKELEESIIFIGTFHSIWGHALTDSLKKLWFLETEEGKALLQQGVKLAYIYMEKSDSYTRKILSLAGIDNHFLIEIKEPTRFKKVYVPDDSILYYPENDCRKYTIEYKNTIRKFLSHIDGMLQHSVPIYDKVYFTRRGTFQNGREWGESCIEKVFVKLGYKVISPEQHSIEDQIRMLRNCSHFATTEGSISHSAIFCRPGTSVEIVRKVNRINYHQLIINEVAGVYVTYIDANKSYVLDEENPLNGPFFMCVTKEIQFFGGKHIIHIPYWMNPVYWWYSLHRLSFLEKYVMRRHVTHKCERLLWKLGA